LKDLCQPGSVAFDVGANVGGLTSVMSRLVGPRGIVCSFEASPRIFNHLQLNIIKQGFHNVVAYQRAVYSRSRELVKIFHGDQLNDSIYNQPHVASGAYSTVESLALDDFVNIVGLVPHLIKMDIEGAEYDALVGSAAVVEKHAPHLILEQQTDDERCLNFLLDRGYRAVDLNTLRPIEQISDYPVRVGLRNVLFVHQTKVSELPYRIPVDRDVILDIPAAAFRVGVADCSAGPFRLPAGRYLADMRFTAQGTNNEMICGARVDDQIILRYHAYTKLLADSYRDWIFDLQREANLELFFSFCANSADGTFSIEGGTLSRVREFNPKLNASFLLK